MPHEKMTEDKRDDRKAYRSVAGIRELVGRFEACTQPAAEFGHREHLLVGLWYVAQLASEEAAADEMRAGLRRFLAHHGQDPQIYHETITRFWMKRVGALFTSGTGAGNSLHETAERLEAECGDAEEIYRYYSRELLATEAARQAWVRPDLRPFDF